MCVTAVHISAHSPLQRSEKSGEKQGLENLHIFWSSADKLKWPPLNWSSAINALTILTLTGYLLVPRQPQQQSRVALHDDEPAAAT